MKIFINPGHAPNPNDDPGAVNRRLGLKESIIARRIGERVATYLANVGYGVKVFQFDGLSQICDAANLGRRRLRVDPLQCGDGQRSRHRDLSRALFG